MSQKKTPIIIKTKEEMQKWSKSMKSQNKTIALIPTMGYLHNGHISLITEAHKYAQLIVVSIYINPSQFSQSEDLSTYPSDFDRDYDKLTAVDGGVDVIFNPSNLYESGHETWVRVENLEKGLCGKSRPVFFRGVVTVVSKLFNIVLPDFAVFGKKDYQQWRVVCRMVRDLDFPVQVIGSEIMREDDGLAMSSRNVYLSTEERQKALSISKSLSKAKLAVEKGLTNCKELRKSLILAVEEAGGKVDYAEIVDQHTLETVEEVKSAVVFCVAAWFGKARLLDNIEISV